MPADNGDFFERGTRPHDVLVAVVDDGIAYRGQGFGRRLVEAAAEEAKSRGARRVT
jgi:predicted GNAT family acetyltransferase